jgi:hypothetical protein
MFMNPSLGLQGYLQKNQWPIWTSMGGSLVTMLAMVCNPAITRSFPVNYGLLGVFTFFQSVMVGFICMVCSLLLHAMRPCMPYLGCIGYVPAHLDAAHVLLTGDNPHSGGLLLEEGVLHGNYCLLRVILPQ